MNINDVEQKSEPVPDLLSSDSDLNKAVEECDEKLSNIELSPAMEMTPAPITTDFEAIKNEANQLLTVVDDFEPAKQPEQNLLIDVAEEAVKIETQTEVLSPKIEEKCELNELIQTTQTEKVSENVLIEAIPDVIPKAIEKCAAATAVVSAEKPKVPAAKTTAKKPLGTKATPAANGVKGVASKTTTVKTTEVKKTIGPTLAARTTTSTTAKAPPTRSSVTSRTIAGVTGARTGVASSAIRATTTTSTTASRVGTRPTATKTTSSTTSTTAKTQEATKPIRKPLTSTATKTGEARVPISMR